MKKNRINLYGDFFIPLQRYLRIMKLTAIFIFIGLMSYASTIYSQSKRLTFDLKNETIESVFKQIESLSEYKFAYNSTKLDVSKKISLKVDNQTIDVVLEKILKSANLQYRIVDRYIIITDESEKNVNSVNSEQAAKKVTGKITDTSGASLPGVSVVVKGTTIGTISDANGYYTIPNVPAKGVLQFSFVGMKMQEIVVEGKSTVDVKLEEEAVGLEEVVAVGYGTQKKVNLTGSIASVPVTELEKRPVTNTVSSLQGKVTGLRIVQSTGIPGREGVSLELRGASSWGTSTTPLVLVDGVVGSLDNIPSTDIESISVLKDAASASIYGSRAANGVILVTTKQGKLGKPTFTYSNMIGAQSATQTPNQIWNSEQYMTLFNKAVARGALSAIAYPQSIIDLYSGSGRDKNAYPDYNWTDAVFRTALMQQHNIGINGGTEAFKYNASIGFLDQDGALRWHSYKRYTGLVNLSAKVNKYITVGTNINYLYGKSNTPYYEDTNFMLMYMTQTPMIGPYLPDGSGRYSDRVCPTSIGGMNKNRNPFWIGNETYKRYENWQANIQGWVDVDFIHSNDMKLKWSTKYATQFALQFQNIYHYTADSYYYLKESDYLTGGTDDYVQSGEAFGPEFYGVKNYDYRTTLGTLFSTLTWEWKKDDHTMALMGGYSQESQKYRWLGGQRVVFPVKTMYELDGMGSSNQSTTGGLTEWAFRSYFGRANYAFKGKYLVEGNFRYDGTSKISDDNRWGFFPSGSVAWRMSEEGFIKNNIRWIDNLKIRASYGLLGNADIGNYPYQETYSTTSYGFSETTEQGVVQTSFKNKKLEWEKTKITDLGLDFNLKENILYGTIDLYNKYTTGILASASIPASAGMDAPTINYGEFKNYGLELSVGHSKKIGDFSYDVSAQLSINRNKVEKYPAPSYGTRIIEEGKPYKDYYLYECTGIFKSTAELTAVTTPGSPQIGDIKFKDQNNSGTIDGDDRVRVKGAYPDFIYSFGANCTWKNFDLNLFFQGVKGQKFLLSGWGIAPFCQASSPLPEYLNAYDPDTNPNSNIPSIHGSDYTPMTGGTASGSTFYLKDASYLRLKNIQLGYNVPSVLLKSIYISQLRVFIGGDNLLTFTSYKYGDPERSGDGRACEYPQIKTLFMGLNLKF
jgi:TonB-linked SusC/RagA family outer membrane protein